MPETQGAGHPRVYSLFTGFSLQLCECEPGRPACSSPSLVSVPESRVASFLGPACQPEDVVLIHSDGTPACFDLIPDREHGLSSSASSHASLSSSFSHHHREPSAAFSQRLCADCVQGRRRVFVFPQGRRLASFPGGPDPALASQARLLRQELRRDRSEPNRSQPKPEEHLAPRAAPEGARDLLAEASEVVRRAGACAERVREGAMAAALHVQLMLGGAADRYADFTQRLEEYERRCAPLLGRSPRARLRGPSAGVRQLHLPLVPPALANPSKDGAGGAGGTGVTGVTGGGGGASTGTGGGTGGGGAEPVGSGAQGAEGAGESGSAARAGLKMLSAGVRARLRSDRWAVTYRSWDARLKQLLSGQENLRQLLGSLRARQERLARLPDLLGWAPRSCPPADPLLSPPDALGEDDREALIADLGLLADADLELSAPARVVETLQLRRQAIDLGSRISAYEEILVHQMDQGRRDLELPALLDSAYRLFVKEQQRRASFESRLREAVSEYRQDISRQLRKEVRNRGRFADVNEPELQLLRDWTEGLVPAEFAPAHLSASSLSAALGGDLAHLSEFLAEPPAPAAEAEAVAEGPAAPEEADSSCPDSSAEPVPDPGPPGPELLAPPRGEERHVRSPTRLDFAGSFNSNSRIGPQTPGRVLAQASASNMSSFVASLFSGRLTAREAQRPEPPQARPEEARSPAEPVPREALPNYFPPGSSSSASAAADAAASAAATACAAPGERASEAPNAESALEEKQGPQRLASPPPILSGDAAAREQEFLDEIASLKHQLEVAGRRKEEQLMQERLQAQEMLLASLGRQVQSLKQQCSDLQEREDMWSEMASRRITTESFQIQDIVLFVRSASATATLVNSMAPAQAAEESKLGLGGFAAAKPVYRALSGALLKPFPPQPHHLAAQGGPRPGPRLDPAQVFRQPNGHWPQLICGVITGFVQVVGGPDQSLGDEEDSEEEEQENRLVRIEVLNVL